VAKRLVVLDLLTAVDVQRPRLALQDTRPAAVRTRLLLPEGIGLLFQEGGEGAFGESGRGGGCHLLQGGEIKVESGPLVAEGPAGDNFAPLGGQRADVLEVLGRNLRACHRQSCLRVTEIGKALSLACCMAKAPAVQSRS